MPCQKVSLHTSKSGKVKLYNSFHNKITNTIKIWYATSTNKSRSKHFLNKLIRLYLTANFSFPEI